MALEYYVPEIRRNVAIDQITDSIVIDTSLTAGGQTERFGYPTGEMVPIDRTKLYKILSKVQASIPDIVTEKGSKSIAPKIEHVKQYIEVTAKERPKINSFERCWKEPPSFSDYYQPRKLLGSNGGRFPTTIDPDEGEFYVDGLSEATIQSIVETVLSERGQQTEVLPILVGLMPGGQGKSTLVRKLAIDDSFYASWGRYPENDQKTYYASYGKVIIELDETTGMDDVNRLKSDISKPFLTFDKKYEGTCNSVRRFSYIMTTNNYSAVREDNRRFHPVEIVNPDKKLIFGDAITPDRMRGIYWIAKRNYDKGIRSTDILREIEHLASVARMVSSDEPLAVEFITA